MDRAALVEVFRTRIADVLEAARAYLEASPDRLKLLIAVERGSLEDDHADRVALDSQRRVALEMPRPSYFAADNATAAAWPPRGVFRPGTTYAEALADVSREVDAYAVDRADNLVTVVDDLVAPDLRSEVLGDPDLPRLWPLGYEVNPVLVAPLFQALTRVAHTAGLPPAEGLSRPRVPARVIAEWAREGINAAYRREMERMRRGGHHPVTFADSEGPGDDLVRWAVERDRLEPVVFGYTRIDTDSLWLVYHAHQSARWRLQPRYAAGLAYGWTLGLLTDTDPPPAFFGALQHVYNLDVERVLAELDAGQSGAPDPLLGLAFGAPEMLSLRLQWIGELVGEARRMVRPIFFGDAPNTDNAAREAVDGPHGPMLRWDARFADAIEAIGLMGTDRAESIRKAAAERFAATDEPAGALWALWYELDDIGPPRWLRTLARVLWADRWRPAFAEQQERRQRADTTVLHPRVLVEVLGAVRARSAGVTYQDGERLALVNDRGAELARLVVDAHTASFPSYKPDQLRRILGSMTAHRWIRYIIPELQSAWIMEGRATSLTMTGGKAGIVEAIRAAGLGGSRIDESVIADVIAAFGSVEARTERTVGTLYAYEMPRTREDWKTYRERKAAPVKLTPGTILDPTRLFDDERHRATPLVRTLPPLQWADRAMHANVATVALILTRELYERRAEIGRDGGVMFTPEEWVAFLVEGGLRNPGPLLWERTRDALLTDGRSDIGETGGVPVPPFLEVIERGAGNRWRFHLAPEHVGARRWIDEAARRSAKGAARGKARAKRRKA